MCFSSLLITILFLQVGIVSLITLLHVDSPLVDSAVNVDDEATEGALSHSTHWVSRNQWLI